MTARRPQRGVAQRRQQRRQHEQEHAHETSSSSETHVESSGSRVPSPTTSSTSSTMSSLERALLESPTAARRAAQVARRQRSTSHQTATGSGPRATRPTPTATTHDPIPSSTIITSPETRTQHQQLLRQQQPHLFTLGASSSSAALNTSPLRVARQEQQREKHDEGEEEEEEEEERDGDTTLPSRKHRSRVSLPPGVSPGEGSSTRRGRTSDSEMDIDGAGQQAGLAIVWLAATLGPKHSLKRLSKREVLCVDVQRACSYLLLPPRPLALRYSSSLMVGVARVHAQQYSFLYTEVHQVFTKMRRSIFSSTISGTGIDENGQQRDNVGDIDLPGASLFSEGGLNAPGTNVSAIDTRMDQITVRGQAANEVRALGLSTTDQTRGSRRRGGPATSQLIAEMGSLDALPEEPSFDLLGTVAASSSSTAGQLKSLMFGDGAGGRMLQGQQRQLGWITGASSYGGGTGSSSISAMTPEEREEHRLQQGGLMEQRVLPEMGGISMTSPTIAARMRQRSIRHRMLSESTAEGRGAGAGGEQVPDVDTSFGLSFDMDDEQRRVQRPEHDDSDNLFGGMDFDDFGQQGGTGQQHPGFQLGGLNTEDFLATSVRTPVPGSEMEPTSVGRFPTDLSFEAPGGEQTSTGQYLTSGGGIGGRRSRRKLRSLVDESTEVPIPIFRMWLSQQHLDLRMLERGSIPQQPTASVTAYRSRVRMMREVARAADMGDDAAAYAAATAAMAGEEEIEPVQVTGEYEQDMEEESMDEGEGDWTGVDSSARTAFRTLATRYAHLQSEPRLLFITDQQHGQEKVERQFVQDALVLRVGGIPILAADVSSDAMYGVLRRGALDLQEAERRGEIPMNTEASETLGTMGPAAAGGGAGGERRLSSMFGMTPSKTGTVTASSPEVGRGRQLAGRQLSVGDQPEFDYGGDTSFDYGAGEPPTTTGDNAEDDYEDPEVLRRHQERRLSEILPWRHFATGDDEGGDHRRSMSRPSSRSRSRVGSVTRSASGGSSGGEETGREVSLGAELNLEFGTSEGQTREAQPGTTEADAQEFMVYAKQMAEMHYFEDISRPEQDQIQILDTWGISEFSPSISSFKRIFSVDSVGKRAASLAFFNVLMLSTSQKITPLQSEPYGDIVLRFNSTEEVPSTGTALPAH